MKKKKSLRRIRPHPIKKSDKFYKILSIVVTLLGAVVPVLITSMVSNCQIISTEKMAEAEIEKTKELAKAERELKIIEMVFDYMISDDETKRELATQMTSLVSEDLYIKLDKIVQSVNEKYKALAAKKIGEIQNFIKLKINEYNKNPDLKHKVEVIEKYNSESIIYQQIITKEMLESIDIKLGKEINFFVISTLSEIVNLKLSDEQKLILRNFRITIPASWEPSFSTYLNRLLPEY